MVLDISQLLYCSIIEKEDRAPICPSFLGIYVCIYNYNMIYICVCVYIYVYIPVCIHIYILKPMFKIFSIF